MRGFVYEKQPITTAAPAEPGAGLVVIEAEFVLGLLRNCDEEAGAEADRKGENSCRKSYVV